jgi:hypothetical protein
MCTQRVIGVSIVGASRLKKQIHLKHRLMIDTHVSPESMLLRLPRFTVARSRFPDLDNRQESAILHTFMR